MVFIPQGVEHLIQKRHGPLSLEVALGSHLVARFELITRLGTLLVERDDRLSSATFAGVRSVPVVGQEILQRRQQEGAKSPQLRIDAFQPTFLQKLGEKRLREVLGVVRRISPAPNEGVKRIPVRLTKLRQRGLGLRGFVSTGVQNDRPERGRKILRLETNCPWRRTVDDCQGT